MSAPVRFLAVAVAGWVLLRGVTAGMFPVGEMLPLAKAEAATAPSSIVPTEFPALEPVQAAAYPPAYPAYPSPYGAYAPYPAPQLRYAAVPVYYPAQVSAPAYQALPQRSRPYTEIMPEPAPAPRFFSELPQLDDWPLSRMASTAGASAPAPTSATPGVPPPLQPNKLDRLQLSSWAHLRGNPVSTGSLAAGGTLGGSQAGARLLYNFDRRLALSLRSSSPIGGSRGGEVAAGVRVTPFPSIPVSLTAERRKAIGRFSTGRNDFAMFLEGGVYQKPIGWNFRLDGYAQAGVVGLQTRDLFADGGFTLMRPLYGRFSIGAGAWGGYQPGLYRVDAGPRLSYRVRPNIRVDMDYRQRLAGAAEPRSGPAITLAADF